MEKNRLIEKLKEDNTEKNCKAIFIPESLKIPETEKVTNLELLILNALFHDWNQLKTSMEAIHLLPESPDKSMVELKEIATVAHKAKLN